MYKFQRVHAPPLHSIRVDFPGHEVPQLLQRVVFRCILSTPCTRNAIQEQSRQAEDSEGLLQVNNEHSRHFQVSVIFRWSQRFLFLLTYA